MSGSLKDALLKAGVISKEQDEKEQRKKEEAKLRQKEEIRREKIENSGPEQEGVHMHHMRHDCGQCEKGMPDVEYYEHHNRILKSKWLCVECADKFSIGDEFRKSAQSSHSKTGFFRRNFGRTLKVTPGTQAPGEKRGQQNSSRPPPPAPTGNIRPPAPHANPKLADGNRPKPTQPNAPKAPGPQIPKPGQTAAPQGQPAPSAQPRPPQAKPAQGPGGQQTRNVGTHAKSAKKDDSKPKTPFKPRKMRDF